MSSKYGLLIDYEFCTGCHTCETACQVELGIEGTDFGIHILKDGPRKNPDGTWEYTYLPLPTSLCNLCTDRVKAGKLPTCVHHCQAAVMTYGPVAELAIEAEKKTKNVLFVIE